MLLPGAFAVVALMADKLRIACAQTVVTVDPAANSHAIRTAMRDAAVHGARLAHFPEGALSGYAGQDKELMTGWKVDWSAVQRELGRVAELAGQLGLWVVVGGNHQLTAPHWPHNSLWVIDDHGRLVDRYDKRWLSNSEVHHFYTPGVAPCTFVIDSFRFGCLLCVEIQFPELWLEQNALDVDCVLFSTFSEDPTFDVLARGHAAANSVWVSVSVPAQCSAAMPSGLIGPHGYRLASARPDGESHVLCVDLDRADPVLDVAVNRARPWRRIARTGEYYARHRDPDDPRSLDRSVI